jgi:hypothetical protein
MAASNHAAVAAAAVAAGVSQVSLEPEGLPSITVVADSPSSWKGDLLAVAVTSDDLHTSGVLCVVCGFCVGGFYGQHAGSSRYI